MQLASRRMLSQGIPEDIDNLIWSVSQSAVMSASSNTDRIASSLDADRESRHPCPHCHGSQQVDASILWTLCSLMVHENLLSSAHGLG